MNQHPSKKFKGKVEVHKCLRVINIGHEVVNDEQILIKLLQRGQGRILSLCPQPYIAFSRRDSIWHYLIWVSRDCFFCIVNWMKIESYGSTSPGSGLRWYCFENDDYYFPTCWWKRHGKKGKAQGISCSTDIDLSTEFWRYFQKTAKKIIRRKSASRIKRVKSFDLEIHSNPFSIRLRKHFKKLNWSES